MALWLANVLCVLSVKPLLCAAVKADSHQAKTVDWDCNNLHDTHRLILIDRIQSLLFVQLLLAFTLFFPPLQRAEPKNTEKHLDEFKEANLKTTHLFFRAKLSCFAFPLWYFLFITADFFRHWSSKYFSAFRIVLFLLLNSFVTDEIPCLILTLFFTG